ncbi:aldo/keto reductase [Amycolatopsis regifaucium]|uniref:Aldo/keto reductase n=1 Tax=Amycolatopsis regifaucium TaxID=546365 RepID=A0A154MAQ1_9PSEU|nr:aldo/keto reductase [Amycolatopsis regifaucium]KZB81728.1 aldo/keto reductase [Amycolatopsis regifaucium]OKA06205.1 aldo/keto reductase [Amycolatopsis regifaucium]SFG69545.1 Predicted oxidoreductase [Amycolatopsis regifaucium]
METRKIARLGRDVGVVGLGCWQLGADWGTVDETDALGVLHAAADSGVTFFDTADVYGDGRSERLVGRFRAERGDDAIFVATKMGRRAEQVPENYVAENFRAWNDRSRANLGMDTLDLVQLHCPPTPVYSSDAVYDALDAMVDEGRIKAYGVSVETCEEALTALARPNVASVQIILNCLRLKPLEQVLPAAEKAGAGIIARVPLASGLLSGRYTASTTFGEDDHRNYNRQGAAFDVGETFSGVPFDVGLEAVERLRTFVPEGRTLAQFALRWIIDRSGVSVVIPGARDAEQAKANSSAAELAPLTAEATAAVEEVYDELLKPLIHPRW